MNFTHKTTNIWGLIKHLYNAEFISESAARHHVGQGDWMREKIDVALLNMCLWIVCVHSSFRSHGVIFGPHCLRSLHIHVLLEDEEGCMGGVVRASGYMTIFVPKHSAGSHDAVVDGARLLDSYLAALVTGLVGNSRPQ